MVNWSFLKYWLTNDKEGLTLATWGLVFSTLMLVATGIGAIGFAWGQLTAERKQRRVDNLQQILDEFNGEIMKSIRLRYAESRLDGRKLACKDDVVFPDGGCDVLDFYERLAFLTRNEHLDD